MLEAASEREKAFVDQWRARVSAGGLDDYDEDGGGGGGGRGRSGAGGGGGTLAPPAYLGNLLSEQNTIAVVARCVRVCVSWLLSCHLQPGWLMKLRQSQCGWKHVCLFVFSGGGHGHGVLLRT